ncbi:MULTISPECIES: restriction endonuclease subunit S [Rhodococcus]|uniref:restriction endonuclease subunit S n=1 Tax=Rhodococcus TaxID=1827 RepID=UPI00193BD6C6|nr:MULTISPECIES: restriction endonuclease subunit S [Rhodococcus]QRI79255.1 restriction endonuclease subunit S [Rhodococcus aetherivorans]QSE62440.1 restriction endonuclease subunit S [Rhodococcus sp. PSBB066]
MADSPEFTTLGSVVTRTGGALQTGPFGSQLHASDYQPTGTPLIMPVNLGDNEVLEKGIARIGATDAHKLRRHALRDGDIIFSRRGDVGRRSLIRETETGWLCGTGCLAARFGPRTEHVNPAYVAEYLGSNAAQTWLVDNAVGGTMPNLNTSILAALPILLLSKREQDRIVIALGDVQETIRTFERLIAKKQAIKQGMMQQLLTGRTRLPNFGESWVKTTLGQLGVFLKGRGIRRDDVRASGIPCIRYGELYTEFVDYTASTRSFVDHAVANTALPLRSGDLLFAGSGETRAEIGICAAYIGDSPAVAGGDIIVLRGSVFNPVYLASLANTPAVVNQKSRAGQGDAVVHINSRALAEITVSLPSRPEQDAIAKVLMDADQEIDLLRERLRKARSVKTGMMQQLLTGRTRLPVETAS